MREELLINVNAFETRVALLQNGVLQEVHLQRAGGYSITGNIYKGTVTRILPGMQAAFVDIGLAKPGFLHASDVHFAPRAERARADESGRGERSILDLLHDGQQLLVQAVKDPISGKGARLTTELALASRYLVLMPFSSNLGVSQRIEDDCERERLRSVVECLRHGIAPPTSPPAGAQDDGSSVLVEGNAPPVDPSISAPPPAHQDAIGSGQATGCIVRTAADGAGNAELASDLAFLQRMWNLIEHSQRYADAPALIYEELPLHIRVVRDLVGAHTESVKIDSRETFDKVMAFVGQFAPEFQSRIEVYQDSSGLFDRCGIEDEIDRALETKVMLKSGGHLLIEQTESMTTIDVNTGGFVGGRNLEETVYRTNMDAAAAIPRQLRLRNLGGIIVIDFIDMMDAQHQRNVIRALEKACESDPARTRISGLSSLGLVEMSRKRTRESLAQQLCQPCGACSGRGLIKTPESMCFEIFRAILRDARKRGPGGHSSLAPVGDYMVRASQAVVDRLLDEDAAAVESLAFEVGMSIRFQVEPSYSNEQFDIVLMQDLRR